MLSALFFCLFLAPIVLLLSFGSYTFNQSTSIVSSDKPPAPQCSFKSIAVNNSLSFYIGHFDKKVRYNLLPIGGYDTHDFTIAKQDDGTIIAHGITLDEYDPMAKTCTGRNVIWNGPPGKPIEASIFVDLNHPVIITVSGNGADRNVEYVFWSD